MEASVDGFEGGVGVMGEGCGDLGAEGWFGGAGGATWPVVVAMRNRLGGHGQRWCLCSDHSPTSASAKSATLVERYMPAPLRRSTMGDAMTTAGLVILELFPQRHEIDFERVDTFAGQCQEKVSSIETGYRGCTFL